MERGSMLRESQMKTECEDSYWPDKCLECKTARVFRTMLCDSCRQAINGHITRELDGETPQTKKKAGEESGPMATEFSVSEIDAVRNLNDWLDDPQGETINVPEAAKLIAAAWYATEDFIRRETGKCSSTHTRKGEHEPENAEPFTCQCCRHFREIGAQSRALIRSVA